MDKITGRAILVVWPANRFGKLGVPDTFKTIPGAGPPPEKPSISLTPPPK
jgi:signal peptidase I